MIDDHKHCIVCGKAMDPDKTVCGPSCEEVMKQQQKKMGRQRTIMLVLFLVMFAVIILVSVLQRGI